MKTARLFLAAIFVVPYVHANSCLDQAGPLTVISGAQSSAYDKRDDFLDSAKVDARGASWAIGAYTPVRIGGGDQICFSGGSIKGLWDPYTTSWSTYHDTYAFSIYGNQMTVENLRVDNYGDAFTVRNEVDFGHNFTVQGAYVTNNHDDCFQNDSMKSGNILDSLFDGCYVFYSSRGYGSGPNNIVRIENNLVRLQGFPTYYGGQAADPYDPTQYRHGGFWKIDEFDKAPKLSIHNNIFRADMDSRGWIPLMPDARSIASCSNNTIVWLGSGPFPETLPSCFKITTDKSVWDNAVADWKYRHGQGPAPTPEPVPVADTTAPQTAITSPANGSFVQRGSSITISASASDNVGVVKVEIFVNGTRICSDSSAPYSCSYNVARKAGRTYKIQSKAYDKAGNIGSSAIISVTAK